MTRQERVYVAIGGIYDFYGEFTALKKVHLGDRRVLMTYVGVKALQKRGIWDDRTVLMTYL